MNEWMKENKLKYLIAFDVQRKKSQMFRCYMHFKLKLNECASIRHTLQIGQKQKLT